MGSSIHVAVIGAGPAGIMAALGAREHRAHVSLYDTNAVVGRKILVTGNGRCNLSNLNATPERYTCADVGFVGSVLDAYGPRRLLTRLEELGILTYATDDGWCYPLSNSAATVADALAAALHLAGVSVHLQTKVSNARRKGSRFTLDLGGPSHTVDADRVVVATGGKAYPSLGSKGEFFPVLERLGHSIAPVRPALAPITARVKRFHRLQGVRLDVRLSLYSGRQLLGETVGNMMFTQYGFSGPAPMDLSHLVSNRAKDRLTLAIDLVPRHRQRLQDLVDRRRRDPVPLRVILGSVLPAKVPPVLLQLAGLPPDALLQRLSGVDLQRVLDLTQHLTAQVTGTRGFRFCQLSTGGVPVTEADPGTMSSRLVPGLYLAGETLDVVGPCGGYNLHWALATGALAGQSCAV